MIRFKNVSKIYPNPGGEDVVALDGINLTINDGEFVFVVGRSGAGKTTLTKLLMREEEISGGILTVDSFSLERLPKRKIPRLRRSMGVVFQDFRLFSGRTAYENISFPLRVAGKKKSLIKQRVRFFLELVELTDKADRTPEELSGGEQQRVAFARAIANNPRMVIADEPTANVDQELSRDLMELLLRINRLGTTVIVITHNMQLVELYNKRTVTIEEGKIVSDKIGGGRE